MANRVKNYDQYTATCYNTALSVYNYSEEKLKLRAVGFNDTTNSGENRGLCVEPGPERFCNWEVNER
ncbi:hypothetical protein AAE026_36705 [Bradyrhizobium sp. DN5]|uniref:hypothetical protein n=1 Tax=Bradyrhizobium sp. DN5 TaxID=3056950 RepID=UPI003525E776